MRQQRVPKSRRSKSMRVEPSVRKDCKDEFAFCWTRCAEQPNGRAVQTTMNDPFVMTILTSVTGAVVCHDVWRCAGTLPTRLQDKSSLSRDDAQFYSDSVVCGSRSAVSCAVLVSSRMGVDGLTEKEQGKLALFQQVISQEAAKMFSEQDYLRYGDDSFVYAWTSYLWNQVFESSRVGCSEGCGDDWRVCEVEKWGTSYFVPFHLYL